METANRSSREWHPLSSHLRALAASRRHSVLLETGKKDRDDDKSFLFLEPVDQLEAWTTSDLQQLLEDVGAHLSKGHYLAGYFDYECGEEFVGLAGNGGHAAERNRPLAWLGVFTEPVIFNHRNDTATVSLPESDEPSKLAYKAVSIHSDGLRIAAEEYSEKIARIHQYLELGHTYQVNFTDRITGTVEGEPLQVYEELLRKQPVPFAAFLNLPGREILSFSPEMFFRIGGDTVQVRPMKGTWPRGFDIDEDAEAAQRLVSDEKNRSEHVMIVDLLRNDLGRVCEAGSVVADELFHAERYATLFQMTSTVSGHLVQGTKASEVFRTLFPSGSITGAPKRRTMEIIRDLEAEPRGIYTGAIGYFAPDGSACFNVAIRTLQFCDNAFSMGVGGGITAGSNATDEFRECQLKGAFLTRPSREFSLIETMRASDGTIHLLQEHLHRLVASAEYFDFTCDLEKIAQALLKSAQNGPSPSKVRLELNRQGKLSVEMSALEVGRWSGKIAISSTPTSSQDLFLRHKTTNRSFYNDQLQEAKADGYDEVLFTNEKNQLTEGAISNIFVRFKDGWRTPPLQCGVLPGVQRHVLLQELRASEAEVYLTDFGEAEDVFLCSSLRGVRPVNIIIGSDGTSVWERRHASGG